MRKRYRLLKSWQPVTSYSSLHHSEGFIVSAIVSVLSIRLLLKITGYPQFGAGNLHIGHLLWGGLLMLVALFALMNFMGDRPRALASVLGGVGFGFFIDELGKYVTKDNNYFFRPTALLLYGLFLLLWYGAKQLESRRSSTAKAHIANTFELLQEGLLYGFNTYEINQLEKHLARLSEHDPMTPMLRELAKQIENRAKEDELGLYLRFSHFMSKFYKKLVSNSRFRFALFGVFFIQAILSIVGVTDFINDLMNETTTDFTTASNIAGLGQIVGATAYGLFIILGIFQLRYDRLLAFTTFKSALLVNIMITQFFAFYKEQFSAVFGLAFNVMLLIAINYLIQEERHHSRAHISKLE